MNGTYLDGQGLKICTYVLIDTLVSAFFIEAPSWVFI